MKENLSWPTSTFQAGQEDEEEAVLASADDDVNPLNFIPDPDELAARISAQENNSGDERSRLVPSLSVCERMHMFRSWLFLHLYIVD